MLKYCLSILLYLFAYNHGICVNFNEMAQGWRKFHGDKFVFESIEKRGDDFVKTIKKFEAVFEDGTNYTADILLESGKRLECKSWRKGSFDKLMKGDQFKNQLKNYIHNGNFEYVIDKKKLLNDGVLDPDKFVKGEFQKIFKANNYELFENFYSSPKMREIFFENIPNEALAKKRFIQMVDEYNESLFNFIKVE